MPDTAADRSLVGTSQLQSLKVGFPIRRSPDQSSFAAPRGLSQRTTSFIASQRQGIHQMPFFHLIALIVDARHVARGLLLPSPSRHDTRSHNDHRRHSAERTMVQDLPIHETCPSNHGAVKPRGAIRHHQTPSPLPRQGGQRIQRPDPNHPSNLLPERSEPSDMPSLHDDKSNERTGRPARANRPQSRSFILGCSSPEPSATHPIAPFRGEMVEPDGIEPTTSCLQSTRSPN